MRAVLDDYVKRIGRSCPIEITEVRDGDAALKSSMRSRRHCRPSRCRGKNLDSNALANGSANFATAARANSSSCVATPMASPKRFGRRPHQKLSLSAMTFSHELAASCSPSSSTALRHSLRQPYPK